MDFPIFFFQQLFLFFAHTKKHQEKRRHCEKMRESYEKKITERGARHSKQTTHTHPHGLEPRHIIIQRKAFELYYIIYYTIR